MLAPETTMPAQTSRGTRLAMEAQHLDEELDIAATIHSRLMGLATAPYASLQGITVPCHALGGDFYHAIVLDACVCAAVADISGKGLPAAIVAALLQGIIHSQFLTNESLPAIATRLNQFLCAREVGKYAALVLLRLYPDGELEYLNCGHVPPFVVNGATIQRLEGTNSVVGLIPSADYISATCKLTIGNRVLLVTDGVTEAENAYGDRFGDIELDAVARLNNLRDILQRLYAFQRNLKAEDDWTFFELSYLGLQPDQARPLETGQNSNWLT